MDTSSAEDSAAAARIKTEEAGGAAETEGGAQARRGVKGRRGEIADEGGKKRRCISSACVPCRRRKSKVSLPRQLPLLHAASTLLSRAHTTGEPH